MNIKPTFTILAPIYNEVENIPLLYAKVSEVMEQTGESWEFVMVDDGSSDGSTEKILDLQSKDEKVKSVIFSRNFGHQIAVTAGLDTSKGEAVIIIDADLQDPPEVILDLIQKWKEGYEVVYAVRSKREGESWFKLFTASAFYRVIQRITDVNIPSNTGDFRLLDQKVVQVMNGMREKHRFLRGMSVWVGFKQTGVEYEREERFAGETKYPLKKMIRFASDAITGFSYFPLQLAMYLGFIAAGISIVAIPIVIVLRVTGSQAFFGQATTLIAVLFLGGVQLISLGLLGEYVGRLYDEAKDRPLYIVREDLELEQEWEE
ncbi:MAG: glycosyltransferase family 2 protein [Anaerolineales bacterium]